MLARAAFLLLVLPLIADAQTTATPTAGQVIISEEADLDAIINIAECQAPDSDGLSFSWALSSAGTAVTPTLIVSAGTVSTDGNCTVTGSGSSWSVSLSESELKNLLYPATGYSSLSDILGVLALDCATPQNRTLTACVHGSVSGTNYWASGQITFDTRPPPAPTLDGVTAVDSALIVDVTPGTVSSSSTQADSATYEAVATAVDGSLDSASHSSSKTSATSFRVEGLQNNVAYNVVARAYSEADNPSADSTTALQGTPIPVDDFWKGYRNAGGREQGGCSSGSAGFLALVAPLVFAMRRRRS